MPIRNVIPENLENAQGRHMKYRTRCGWGGNHIRKLNGSGEIMASISARNEDPLHPIASAIDGYRPHENPLDASYLGFYQSTGRPLLRAPKTMLIDNFVGAFGSPLNGRTPDTEANNFSSWSDPGGQYVINASNQLVSTGGFTTWDQVNINVNFDEYIVVSQFNVSNIGSFGHGHVVRWKSVNDFLLIQAHNGTAGTVQLQQKRNGSLSLVALDTTWTSSTGNHTMLTHVTKKDIRVFIDGVQVFYYAIKFASAETSVGIYNPTDYCESFSVYRAASFYEDFGDWTNWNLATFGTITGNSNSISGKWGKLVCGTSAASSLAGYVGTWNDPRVTLAPFTSWSYFQMQIGKNKNTPVGTDFNEVGMIISDDNTITNPSLETNAILISVRSNASGTYLRLAEIVAGVETEVSLTTLGVNEYSSNVRVEMNPTNYSIYENKNGLIETRSNVLPFHVYPKVFARTNSSTTTMNGYLRDIGIFPERFIRVGGEVGYEDEFVTFDDSAWDGSIIPGYSSYFTQIVEDDEDAVRLDGTYIWRTVKLNGRGNIGDFRLVNRAKLTGDRINWFFRCSPGFETGYGVQLKFDETPKIFKNSGVTPGIPWGQIIGEGDIADAVGTGDMEITIEALGPFIKVYKNGNLIVEATDTSYTEGYIGASSYGDVIHKSIKLSERGLQQPVQLRVDHGMVHNPSFEEWDEDEGLTDATTENVANGWKGTESTSGSISRDLTGGVDGGSAQKITIINPGSDPLFLNEIFQRNMRFLSGHKYRLSCYIKVNQANDLPLQGFPIFSFAVFNNANQREMGRIYPIANPTENLLVDNQWHQLSFEVIPTLVTTDIDELYLTLRLTTNSPGTLALNPKENFEIWFDHVMVEDLTGYNNGEYGQPVYIENPDSYRGLIGNRESTNDYFTAFAKLPLNKIWRSGEEKGWGLIDENDDDLYSSRDYTDIYPGQEWKMSPQWIQMDFSIPLVTNQVLLYALYSSGVRWFHLTGDSSNYLIHPVTKVFDGSVGHDSESKWDKELETSIESRYMQLVIIDSNEENDLVTLQQVELYNYVDESNRISQQVGSGPQVSITTTRSGNVNALPDATQFSFVLTNYDGRYTPRNKFSEIYGYTQKDGLGDIRSNVPARISIELIEEIPIGETEYAFKDDCVDDGYWTGSAMINPFFSSGMIAFQMPSSPPADVESRTAEITTDVTYFNKLKFNIDSVENPYPEKLQWRIGIRKSTETIPDATWLTDWNDSGAGLYEFDMLEAAGLSGVQTFAFVIALQYSGGFPPDFSTFVMLDYFYLENVPVITYNTYETLMLIGTIGMDKNVGGALGITLDGQLKTANIEGVDFTVALDQPTPNDKLDIIESMPAEELMEMLCHIAGIPKQDQVFDSAGIIFDVVVLQEQTLREQLNQIVEAIGGRIYPLQDGRLVYQNEYPYRTWEQSEKSDFMRGIITNLDMNSIPGQLTIGNVNWLGVNNFNVLPESEVDVWNVEDAEPSPRRYISGGKYFVQIPSGSYTTMLHTKNRAFNKTTGFTIEFIAYFGEGNVGYNMPFDIWGFCDNVVDRDTASSAWRLKIFRQALQYGGNVYMQGGGTITNGVVVPSLSQTFISKADKYRIRITVKNNDVKVWVNNTAYPQGGATATFQLCSPKLIDWAIYQQGWNDSEGLRDTFTGSNLLKNHVPDKNETGNTSDYTDPNDIWIVDGGFVRQRKWAVPAAPSWDDGSSYFELNINQYDLYCGIYLDRTTATHGGIRFRYIDANNYRAFLFNTVPDLSNPSKMIVQAYYQKVEGGVVTIVQTLPNQSVFAGQCQINISTLSNQNNMRWRSLVSGGSAWFATSPFTETPSSPFYGATKFGFASSASQATSFDDLEINASGIYYKWPDQEYVGKIVIGPTPVEHMQNKFYESDKNDEQSKNYNGQTYRNNFWIDQYRHYLSGDAVPINTGQIESQSNDCTVDIDSYGIFEAEIGDVEYINNFATIDFYVSKSDDDITYGSWESITLGSVIPGIVKRYIKWKAVLTLTDPTFWFGSKHWWPTLKSVTINWLVSTIGLIDAFRVTYDISKPTSETIIGQELNSISYSMGNPKANRIPVLVNKWVEQTLTDYSGAGPLWESTDLPQTIGSGDVYEVRAQYSDPSKKSTGGTIRHAHVVINTIAYSINDGVVQQVCGSCLVSFSSGQSIGIVTIESTAAAQTISVVAIDSIYFKRSSDIDGEEHVFVEDVESQNISKRIIESAIIDNSFAMTRSIATTFGNARLDKDKKHQEVINSINFPIKPSVNLGRHAVVNVPNVGLYEKQLLLSEVQHVGFTTTISGVTVDSHELETFDPLSLEPELYFASHRLENCQSTYIFRMRRLSDSSLIDVYDVKQGSSEYKTTANGVWIDASSDTYYIRTWYDQSGNGIDAVQATNANQPEIEWNEADTNYWPCIKFLNKYLTVNFDLSPGVNPNLTIFSMVQPIDVTGNRKIYGHDDGGYDRALGCDSRASKNFCYFDGTATVQGVTNVYNLLKYIAIHEWQAALTSVWVNDSQYIDDAAVSNGNGAPTFVIGNQSIIFLEPWWGCISQFCLFSSVMTDDDRNNVRDYINNKYKVF